MYSTNFRDRFPKHHILSCTRASKRGATKLIDSIFTESVFVREGKTRQAKFVVKKNVERKEGEKAEKKVKKTQRLPKRFVKMKGLFEKVLRRHKRCRFSALLRHHCKERVDLSEEKIESKEKDVEIQENEVEIQEGHDDKVKPVSECDGGVKMLTKQEQYDRAVLNFTPLFQVNFL
jgi:hypothetical protein